MTSRSHKRENTATAFPSSQEKGKRPRLVLHESTDSVVSTTPLDDSPGPLTPIVNDSQSRPKHMLMTADSTDDLVGLDASLPKITDAEAIEQEEETGKRKRSLYVDAFDLALDTVLEEESFLFNDEEHSIFKTYKALDYEAQYLYVRLFLRKTNAWFRVSKLGYFYDIKDMPTACSTLQSSSVAFAIDQSAITTMEEASTLLTLDELKLIAKEHKIVGSNKAQLVANLRKTSNGQGRLGAGGQLGLRYDGKGRYENRNHIFLREMLETTGTCIRLTEAASTLFSRVHLVFYRSTEWTEKSLTTLILARIARRNFPKYFVCRTANIFPTRDALLDFEKAIKLQSEVDNCLEMGVPTKEDLQRVLDIMDEVYDRWEVLCEIESKKTNIEEVYLRRFSAAWVYTRLVHKGVYVLGRHKAYERERNILQKLIAQRVFHPSRRGGWYQRLALIEEHYFHEDTPTSKREWLQIALDTAERGLQDPDTHVIFHYDLQKRISKLEKKLNVPKKDQHEWVWSLRKPLERTIISDRILDEAGPTIGKKTIWKIDAEEGEPSEVSVEEMCLHQYRKEGWKGFHSEGGIMRTIFAYLFNDILFLPLPNVFQTAYQTCPLDLHTDSFYASRASEINHRLVAISNGEGPRFVREVHAADSERKTCIIGLDWNFDPEEMCEIVECLGGEALVTICKVLCQEYRERGGGMPDLFLWNHEKRKAKFVEIKSENDRLSDTQRLWIDVLTGAGVETELCAAVNRRNVKEK